MFSELTTVPKRRTQHTDHTTRYVRISSTSPWLSSTACTPSAAPV